MSITTNLNKRPDRKILQAEDTKKYNNSSHIQKNGKSVAVIIKDSYLLKVKERKNHYYKLNTNGKISLAQFIRKSKKHPYREDQPFQEEPVGGCGTAFLITPDTIITAAHNLYEEKQWKGIDKIKFIFGFKTQNAKPIIKFPADNVYTGLRVIACKYYYLNPKYPNSSEKHEDWAIIRLNRKVKNRIPLTISNEKIKKSTEIYMLGHPTGLPLKFSGFGKITQNKHNYLLESQDIDVFGGNSGSPVFNKKHQVIGFLVRGTKGFKLVKSYQISSWVMDNINEKNTSEIQRITTLSTILKNHIIPSSQEAIYLLNSALKPVKKDKKFTSLLGSAIDHQLIIKKVIAHFKISHLSLENYYKRFQKHQEKLLSYFPIGQLSTKIRAAYCITNIAISCIKEEMKKMSGDITKNDYLPSLQNMMIKLLEKQEDKLEELLYFFAQSKSICKIPKNCFTTAERNILDALKEYQIINFSDSNMLIFDSCIEQAIIIREKINEEENLIDCMKEKRKSRRLSLRSHLQSIDFKDKKNDFC